MNLNTQEIKRVAVKSPFIPLFFKGENMVSSLWQSLPAGRQGRRGGIFKTLKSYIFRRF